MKKYITVAGNIGVGKSTLVSLLCERMGWQPFYEPVAENPYLSDFYQDMSTWGFHSQVYFLIHRLRTHRQLIDHPTSVIQDRSVYEDAEVFALNLFHQGFIHERDFRTYQDLYSVLTTFLPPPDLVIYLRASVQVLVRHIEQRNRHFERHITPEYLAQLNVLYEKWAASFNLCPLLTVPVDNLDYVTHAPHLNLIVRKVEEKLTGKEEVAFSENEVNASL